MSEKLIGVWKEQFDSDNGMTYPSIIECLDEKFKERNDYQKILQYLKKGKVVSITSNMSFPNIFTGEVYSGSLLYLSDGKYVWPDNLIRYVENHNVALPNDFIEHIINHNYILVEYEP
jgi:hypothetical protein